MRWAWISTSSSCARACSAQSRGARRCARRIEELLNIDAIDVYGLSEIMGPGVATECLCKQGMHISEDHVIPEIIDPRDRRAIALRRAGRAGVHDDHQGGLSRRYATARTTYARSMPSRADCGPHVRAHEPHNRPHRRYADNPRRERVPDAGRVRC